MAFVGKEMFRLNIDLGLGGTDDDKTPEYPLSDDHPLSLSNRAFLLKDSTLASLESEHRKQPTRQINTQSPPKLIPCFPRSSSPVQTTTYDKSDVMLQDQLQNKVLQNPSYGESSMPDRKLSERSPTKTETLRTATETLVFNILPPELHESKDLHNTNIFKELKSIQQCPIGNAGADQLPQSNSCMDSFDGKGSKHFHEKRITHSNTLTDTNNNAGDSRSHLSNGYKMNTTTESVENSTPNENTHSIKNSSEHQTDMSSQGPTPDDEDRPDLDLSTNSKEVSINDNFDTDEKNVPPQLSPVIAAKCEVTTLSHRLSFPPILTPVKLETRCESVTPISSSTSDNFENKESHINQPPKCNTEDEPEVIRSHEKMIMKILMPELHSSTPANDQEQITDPLLKSSKPETIINYAKVDEVEKKNVDIRSDNLQKERPSSESANKECPEDRQMKENCKAHSLGENPVIQNSSKRTTENSDKLCTSPCAMTADISQRSVLKVEHTPDSDKSLDPQMYLSTDAKTVTSRKSCLCYPYSGQNVCAGTDTILESQSNRLLRNSTTEHILITPSLDISKEPNTCPLKTEAENRGLQASSRDSLAMTTRSSANTSARSTFHENLRIISTSSPCVPRPLTLCQPFHYNPKSSSSRVNSDINENSLFKSEDKSSIKYTSMCIAEQQRTSLEDSFGDRKLISASTVIEQYQNQGFNEYSGQYKSSAKSRGVPKSGSQNIPLDKNSVPNSKRGEREKNLCHSGLGRSLSLSSYENGQIEPLDLSSKHITSPQKTALDNVHNIRAKEQEDKSSNEGTDRFNDHNKRAHKVGDTSLPEIRKNIGCHENDSHVNPHTMANGKASFDRKARKSFSGSENESLQMIKQKDSTKNLILLHQPNIVIDVEEIDSKRISPQTIGTRKNNGRFGEKYLSSSPDEKTYSHLAYAAILSKGKKSSMGSNVSSEDEDFLDFLRRDDNTRKLDTEKTFTLGNTSGGIKNRLRNGDYIDLTKEISEDVLSVSSDEGIKDVNIAPDSWPFKETQCTEQLFTEKTTKSVSIPNVQSFYENLNDANSNSRDLLINKINQKMSNNSKERDGTFKTIPSALHENSAEYSHLEHSHPSEQESKIYSSCQELLSCPDASKICHIKEHTLSFSRHQKALMARRIKDIIFRNSSLLPEGHHPLQTSMSGAMTKSHILHMPTSTSDEKSLILKAEAEEGENGCTAKFPPFSQEVSEGKCVLSIKHLKTQPPEFDNPVQSHMPKTNEVINFNMDTDNRRPSTNEDECFLETGSDRTMSSIRTQTPNQTFTNGEDENSNTPYKTVWQTHFVTDSDVHKCSNQSRKHNRLVEGDIVQRLELMHNAADKISQASQSIYSQKSLTTNSPSLRKKRRWDNQTDTLKNEYLLGAHSVSCDSDYRIDLSHPPPPLSMQPGVLSALYESDHINLPKPVQTVSGQHCSFSSSYDPNLHSETLHPPLSGSGQREALPAAYNPDHHTDRPLPPTPVSGQLNRFIPSPFVVAPCYAMAYPLCYPAFQGTAASNQPIILSPHSATLDVVENTLLRPMGKKRARPRRSKPLQESTGRKKRMRHKGKNKNSSVNLNEANIQNSIMTPPEENTVCLNTEDALNDTSESFTRQTSPKFITNSNPISNSASLQYRDNIMEKIKPTSDNESYCIQTRIEDGHTVLSIQDKMNNPLCNIPKTAGCNDFLVNHSSFTGNCRVDLDNHHSNSIRKESPPVSRFSRNRMTPISFQDSLSGDRNLDTLALASEKREKMRIFRSISAIADTETGRHSTPFLGVQTSNATLPSLNTHYEEVCSASENIHNPIQAMRASPWKNDGLINSEPTKLTYGIAEKEKLVTEMLATMMQSRKLNTLDKDDEN